MKLGTLSMAAGLLSVGLAGYVAPGFAQGPMWDVVKVNLPYTVTVGDKTLEPGEYTIKQNHDSGGGARILLIYSDNGMKFQTSAMTIPALDPNTPRDTTVVLNQLDNDYYMSKMWIQGKDYGYEFPVPDKFRQRQKESIARSMPATYSSTKAEADTTVAVNKTDDVEKSNIDRSTLDQTAGTVATQSTRTQENTIAQTETTKIDEQAQTVTPVNPPVSSTPTYTDANSANREADSTPEHMPATAAGWLMMVLGGGSLSGLGLALRRKRQ